MLNFLKKIKILFLYFAILLAVSLNIGYHTDVISYIPVKVVTNQGTPILFSTMNNRRIQDAHGQGDAASYARGGANLAENGRITKENQWLLKLWPPGMFTIHALAIKLSGIQAPTALYFQIFICFLWALNLWAMNRIVVKRIHPNLAFLLPLTLLGSVLFRSHMISIGVLWSDTYATAFYCLSSLLIVLASMERNLKLAVLSGLMLALGAYFRSSGEMTGLIFSVLTLAAVLVAVITSADYRKSLQSIFLSWQSLIAFFKRPSPFGAFNVLIIAFIVFHMLTLPYRVYNYSKWRKFDWQKMDSIWALNWDKTLISSHSFLAAGGIHTACLLEPKLCDEISVKMHSPEGLPNSGKKCKKLSLKTFKKHPVSWFMIKSRFLPPFWMQIPEDWLFTLCSILLILAPIGALFRLLFMRQAFNAAAWVSTMSLLGFQLLAYLFVHFETRYFYSIKMFSLMFCLLMIPYGIANILGRRQQNKAA